MNTSIKDIKSSETTSYVKNGITYFKNPMVNCELTSDKRVWNPSVNRFLQARVNNTVYNIILKGNMYASPTSWNSLISYFFGLEKSRHSSFELIDKNLGWIPSNIKTIQPKVISKSAPKKLKTNVKTVSKNEIEISEHTNIKGFDLIKYSCKSGYFTTDGNVFDCKDKAMYHQDKIDEAVRAVKIMIDNNSGWSLARKVFDSICSYDLTFNTNIPLREIVEIESDIKFNDGETEYEFIQAKKLGVFNTLLTNKRFTLDKVTNIIEKMIAIENINEEILDIIE